MCGRPRPASGRYPRALCAGCAGRVTDARGVPLRLGNASLSGGLWVEDLTGAARPDVVANPVVLVDGRGCWAQEARFGGVVVQPYDAEHPRHPDHRR